jgi:hypothetical protein
VAQFRLLVAHRATISENPLAHGGPAVRKNTAGPPGKWLCRALTCIDKYSKIHVFIGTCHVIIPTEKF